MVGVWLGVCGWVCVVGCVVGCVWLGVCVCVKLCVSSLGVFENTQQMFDMNDNLGQLNVGDFIADTRHEDAPIVKTIKTLQSKIVFLETKAGKIDEIFMNMLVN